MGHLTVVIVNNDALSYIKRDLDFGKHLADAILRWPGERKAIPVTSSDQRGGTYSGAAKVLGSYSEEREVFISVGQGGDSARIDFTLPRTWRKRPPVKK